MLMLFLKKNWSNNEFTSKYRVVGRICQLFQFNYPEFDRGLIKRIDGNEDGYINIV